MIDSSVGSSYIKKTGMGPLKTLLPYLWLPGELGLRWRLIGALVFVVMSKVTLVGIPLFYKEAINLISLNIHESFQFILLLLGAYGTSRAFSTLFSELKDFLFAKVEQRAVRLLAIRVFNHLNELSLRFHLDRQTGGILRTLERGSRSIETFFKFTTFSLFPTFLEIAITTSMIGWLYGPVITGWVGINILVYVLFTLRVTHWRTRFLKEMHDADNHSNNQAVESLLNYETVKYFGNEELEKKRFEKAQLLYEKSAIKNKTGLSLLNAGQGLIISLGLIGVLCIFAFRIKENILTLGDLVLINTYLLQLYAPLNNLGFAYREIKRSLVEMADMFDLLKEPVEVRDVDHPHSLEFKGGEIVFKNVSFSYAPERPILKRVSFEVPAGKKVALVGASGSGKSTIARLLFRFYDRAAGDILIDRQDISQVSQSSLRKLIGVVPQDVVLFNETIYYNIQYGNPNATPKDVEQAARSAQIHDFIQSLPQGYNTKVGERGLKLSGGEKQRIAIARTLLKKPRIFLFDEATSSLDTATEKSIQASLNQISKGCSTLVVAHRLSTIVDAYKIFVLANGEIIEAGNHKELLKKRGAYAELWDKQSQSDENA
ncbi:MAG: ABCB family ABC transporter ATP-binding protein/permease [Alphaproteobacteria bacterium]